MGATRPPGSCAGRQPGDRVLLAAGLWVLWWQGGTLTRRYIGVCITPGCPALGGGGWLGGVGACGGV